MCSLFYFLSGIVFLVNGAGLGLGLGDENNVFTRISQCRGN